MPGKDFGLFSVLTAYDCPDFDFTMDFSQYQVQIHGENITM